MAGAHPGSAAGTAARRLRRELETLKKAELPQLAVQPSGEDLLVWHFVLHSLGAETPYHGGCYHGKIIFPGAYPLAPPSILMLTPSGRLETGKRLCLSMTDFHPESWNPAWSVETILVGLLSFFLSDKEAGLGAITAPIEERRQLAASSLATNLRDAEFKTLFPEFTETGAEMVVVDVDATEETTVAVEVEVNEQAVTEPPNTLTAVAVQGGETAAAATGGAAQDDEEPMECWMCRDVTDEPLIQPCACRGSMSGVHASCVEDWIRHHRRNAQNDEPPRCSVCNQFYCGKEQQPGIRTFVKLMCLQGMRQCLRTLSLIVLVCGYQAAASQQHFTLPLAVRVAIIVIFSLVAVHKVAIITVSLPLHQAAPENRYLQRLFIADYTALSMHVAEAMATVLILSFGHFTGTLALPYYLPFALGGLLPWIKTCVWGRVPSLDCLVSWAKMTCMCISAPIIIVVYPIVWTVQNPRLALKKFAQAEHPCGPGPQVNVAFVAALLCSICKSNVAPVVVWLTHCVFLLYGLLDLFVIKRLPWQRSRPSVMSWLLSLQATLLVTYYINAFCTFSQGWGAPDLAVAVVHSTSVVWFLLVSALTVTVNWSTILERYRLWQRRHGRFTLQVPAAPAVDSQATAADREAGLA